MTRAIVSLAIFERCPLVRAVHHDAQDTRGEIVKTNYDSKMQSREANADVCARYVISWRWG